MTTFLEKTRNEELHLILLPAELVPDLEAQIVNQIGDLLSDARKEERERLLVIPKGATHSEHDRCEICEERGRAAHTSV